MPQLRPYATKEMKINIKKKKTTQDFSNLKATDGALPGSEPLSSSVTVCIRSGGDTLLPGATPGALGVAVLKNQILMVHHSLSHCG